MFQARKLEISPSTVFICETETGGSDLVGFLETQGDSAVNLHVGVTVLDGVEHISPNGESKIFAEYEKVVFIPRVFLELGKPNAWISSGMYT